MVSLEDVIKLEINEEDIVSSLKLASENSYIDNLRDRHPLVSLDSRIRGFLGEFAIKKFLINNKIRILEENLFNSNLNMDIDIVCVNRNLEIKTSLIPKSFGSLHNIIESADIKIIKRLDSVDKDSIDIYIQIYYDLFREDRDDFLKELDIKQFESLSLDDKINFLKLHSYKDNTLFVAWISKEDLIRNLNKLPKHKQTWKYGKREFWTCKIKDCNPPNKIIEYLRGSP